MFSGKIFFHFVPYFVTVGFVISLDSTTSSPSLNAPKLFLNKDSSHEENHSINEKSKSTSKHMDLNQNHVSLTNIALETPFPTVKKIRINTNKTHPGNFSDVNLTYENISDKDHKHLFQTEGGLIDISSSSNKKTTTVNDINVNISSISKPPAINTTGNKIVKVPLSTANSTHIVSSANNDLTIEAGSSERPKLKRIHGRPGVVYKPEITTVPSSTSSEPVHAKKPLFTMITGDIDDKESESFIESPTTGRDYVLPIVLIILALPVVAYIIKLIYKRGTEFTERQQYHRMYLIDGMYNSR